MVSSGRDSESTIVSNLAEYFDGWTASMIARALRGECMGQTVRADTRAERRRKAWCTTLAFSLRDRSVVARSETIRAHVCGKRFARAHHTVTRTLPIHARHARARACGHTVVVGVVPTVEFAPDRITPRPRSVLFPLVESIIESLRVQSGF